MNTSIIHSRCAAAGMDRAMRRAARLGAALLVWSALSAAPAHALGRGETAPAFELQGPQGAVQLTAYRGKVVYVDFWASWCGPCRQSFPWMNQMQAKYGARGLQIIGVNLDASSADATQFLAGTPAQFAIAYDPQGATPRGYSIKGMPSSVLIGPDGKVLSEHAGFREADRVELEAKIVAALGAAK